MKLIPIILLSFVLGSVVVSCGHKGDKNDPLYKEVMVIHDEVMPKLSTIHKLKKKLRKTKESDSPAVLQLLTDLDKADEGMMDWMQQFSPPADGPDRKIYLTGQLSSVTTMAADINNSIAAAEQFLNENK